MAALSPDDSQRLYRIFFPLATRERERIDKNGIRFVHYTSAQAAISMIKNEEVWMRQTSCMNDFSEVLHGLAYVQHAYYYKEPGKRLQSLLNDLFPDLRQQLEQVFFQAHGESFATNTYVVCVSEHCEDENEIGRLSMWRAYGRGTGVALVLNSGPFIRPSDALKAWSSPVLYPKDHPDFTDKFAELVSNLEKERTFLANFEPGLILAFLFNAFRFAAVCTKHRGFLEEKEWRVVYSPLMHDEHDKSPLIKDHQVIQGVPQRIYKVPLQDIPEEGLKGIEIPEFIDQIIVGPTQYPAATCQAFVDLLVEAGTQEPQKKVVCSKIPLRT